MSVLLREGAFGDGELALLNLFMRDIWTLEVNAPDLSCDNVAFDAEAGQFILVDGIGEKTLLPVRAWIGALNRKKLHQMAHRIGGKIKARWDTFNRRPRPARLPRNTGSAWPTNPTVRISVSCRTAIMRP